MSKIEAVAVAMHPNGENLYVVDRTGKLWVKFMKATANLAAENGGWHLVELPEEPATAAHDTTKTKP